MKKLFRMALVLALAGSALLYTSCTKDYSPDISSLQDQITGIENLINGSEGLPWVKQQLQGLRSELDALKPKVTIGDDALDQKITNLSGRLDNAISTINSALDGKADAATVETELGNLQDAIDDLRDDLEARLDDIDGEDGRLAALEEAIDSLTSASEAIDSLFATYAKFIQSIAYVPGTSSGLVGAFPYYLVSEDEEEAPMTDPLLVATFKITPPDARARATMETASLVAVQTKAAAAAPDTLTIKKLVYRDDAPGYVDVYATFEYECPYMDGRLDGLRREEEYTGTFAIALAVQQEYEDKVDDETNLIESVTSDFAPAFLGWPQDIIFEIWDAEAEDIVDPYEQDEDVRISPSTENPKAYIFSQDRWSVVADIAGSYLTPEEAMELFEVDDIALVSPLPGDTMVGNYPNPGDYFEVDTLGFQTQVGPKSPKTIVDLINSGNDELCVYLWLDNSHSYSGRESGEIYAYYLAVPDTTKYTLTPVDLYGKEVDIVIPWDYKSFDNIADTLISKVRVSDNGRDKFIGAETLTWNAETETDYTEGNGAVYEHSNDPNALDVVIVSAAEYGVADSTYVYSLQKYAEEEATMHVGEFEYTVKARPADAVIELGPIDTMVHFEGPTTIAVEAITAAYELHESYYDPYTLAEVAADAFDPRYGKLDSTKVTLNGEPVDVALTGDFGWDGESETTSFTLPLDQVGEWKVYVYTHFANVGYTFIVTIDAKNNPARIAPKETYVTVENPENPKEYSVQIKGDVDTSASAPNGQYHYYLVDEPFQDYIKVVNYATGSDSLIIDLQTITEGAQGVVGEPSTPVGLERLEADATVANLAEKGNYEWADYDSLQFKVAVRLIPEVKQDVCVDSAAVRLWTVDPIPVFDAGNGIVVEHEKDQLAKTNFIAGINIVDFQGIALNDENGLRPIGPDEETGELVVDYDQAIEVDTTKFRLVSGVDYLEEVPFYFELDEDGNPYTLCLDLNQGVIVTPIVVEVPITLHHMLDRGMEKNTIWVQITFQEKEEESEGEGA